MFFALLTFFAAFSIEFLGTYVSVIGLSALFGSNPVIISLAIGLDLGKLIVVSLLYKHWERLGVFMRSYALVAAIVTMVITSAGAAGYLSGEFQKAITGTQEITLQVDTLKAQQAKYEERKKQIDDQIAAIPEKYSANQRIRLMNQFKAEQADLQAKIAKIDTELPELQAKQISVNAKAGPILTIAKSFDITVEEAIKWVIAAVILVFDPLAVFLVIAGNFLWRLYKETPKEQPKPLVPEELVVEAEAVPATPIVLPEPMPEPAPNLVADGTLRPNGDVIERFEDGEWKPMELPKAKTFIRQRRTVPRRERKFIGPVVNGVPLAEQPEAVIEAPIIDPVVEAPADAPVPVIDAEPITAAPAVAEVAAAAEPTLNPIVKPEVHPIRRTMVNANGVRVPVRDVEPQREQITLSSLGAVKADPKTITDVGALDPSVRPDIFPPKG